MAINIDIIVVNWNSAKKTFKAISPYLNFNNGHISCNIIVVDNNSTSGSLEQLIPLNINLIRSKINLGFGKACNLAYQYSKGEYILLLNPDTISTPAHLEKLVTFLEVHPEYAATGPSQFNDNGEIKRSCGRFPSFKTAFFDVTGLSKIIPSLCKPVPVMLDWDHSFSKDVDHVMGSYLLIKKSVLKQVGFMDDKYFVYWEDMDLSKRMHIAGFKIFYNREVSIFHEGGGTGDKQLSKRLYYSIYSRRIYWKKYLSKAEYLFLIFVSISIEPLLRVSDSFIKRKGIKVRDILNAYANYLRSL